VSEGEDESAGVATLLSRSWVCRPVREAMNVFFTPNTPFSAGV
jgi:hypothetical protein